MTVTATDAGTGMLSDTITVTINVTDVTAGDTAVANSAPAFNDGPSTTRSVPENTEDGDIGLPVAATDVDRGDTLTYGLQLGTDDAASFAIDSMTGQLKTMADLDYEADNPPKTSYMVTVTVTDGRDPVNTVSAVADDTISVTITVTDVNEAPEFPTIETQL